VPPLKSELCGLPLNDPRIRAARQRLKETGANKGGGEEPPELADDRNMHPDGPLSTKPQEMPPGDEGDLQSNLQKCSQELKDSHAEIDETVERQDQLMDVLLTLGGMVSLPKDSGQFAHASPKSLREHVKKQVESLAAQTLAVSDASKVSSASHKDTTKQDKSQVRGLTQQLALAGKKLRASQKQLTHQTRDFDQLKQVFLQLISQVESQEGQAERERGHLTRGEFWKSSEVIDKLHEAVQGGDSPNLNIKEEGWAEFLEQLIRHEAENHDQDAQFDPVKMGIAYSIAIAPALLLLCLSRFQAVKDLFVLQGIFFNSMLSGIFALLALLSLYCNFNPLKIVLGHHHAKMLPEFELILMSCYVYVAACNILLLFIQPRATEKLHAIFSIGVGGHLFWMLYTLRQDDTGFQQVFYLVYFVCFGGCTVAKLRQVAVMHLAHVRKTNGKRVKAVKDEEKGGAVFELGDDTEIDNLVD